MSIRTAVIPAAGNGTRALPLASTLDKGLLPIYAGNSIRPVMDWVIEDCADAGIEQVIIVATEHGQAQFEDFFFNMRPDFKNRLQDAGKTKTIEQEEIRRLSRGVKIDFVYQPLGHYGTGFALSLARDLLKDEKQFVFMSGDELVYRQDEKSELGLLINTFELAGTEHAMMGYPVDEDDAPKYGNINSDSDGRLISIKEKPPRNEVSHNPFVNISRFILGETIWPCVDEIMARNLEPGEEYFVTDAVNLAVAQGQKVKVHQVGGTYLDCGNSEALRLASNFISDHPKSRN